MLAEYFRQETKKLADACLADVKTLEDWEAKKGEYRRQLFEMLGLDPLPERTPLNATVTGKIDHDEFTVEKLYFQSRPGLYVTGNLYVPKERAGRLPAILYVCGHSRMVKDGVSFGNKAGYQHHGAWFARHGYVCLVIDSLQLGEIEATHHGTYGVKRGDKYEQMWWWNSRGYTPAGVEAWNCMRALDYLQSREEVDPERLGVTGRSGGGAYSWWIAALDERIKAAVPVAGITDLWNHVVEGTAAGHPKRSAGALPNWTNVDDGCVSGHCDCMYIVNTYRWDYPLVAALVAPRPLLISNTDKDTIFPLEGVVRLHQKVRQIYRLYGKEQSLGLQITEGPHKDTQELQVHAMVWFDRFLKNEDRPIRKPAEKVFEPEQLRVFSELPSDQINTRIHDQFVKAADPPKVPKDKEEWAKMREEWMTALKEKVFRGWPEKADPLDLKKAFDVTRHGLSVSAYDFTSQGPFRLRMYVLQREGLDKPASVSLMALDDAEWRKALGMIRVAIPDAEAEAGADAPDEEEFQRIAQSYQSRDSLTVLVAPRGIGPTAWADSQRAQTQIRRRFMLLGQTLEGMRVYDVVRSAEAVRSLPKLKDAPLHLGGNGDGAIEAIYASLFVPNVERLTFGKGPTTHMEGPDLLNVLRFVDVPQAVAMAAEKAEVGFRADEAKAWDYPVAVIKKFQWDKNWPKAARDK
ncbi:MAG: acetylxylan esterase [Planctomycetia bacterium]|nr:acetylxylan esterase [Planctomycetia bacterium]